MSDISALTKAKPDVQEQIKKLRNALDPSKKSPQLSRPTKLEILK